MDEVLYSIKESTLTDIGDALRRRHGETEWVNVSAPCVVNKSHNATGFDSYEGNFINEKNTLSIASVNNAYAVNVKIRWDIPNGVILYICPGYHLTPASALESVSKISEVLTSEEICNYTFEGYDSVTFVLAGLTSSVTNGYDGLGYYAEIVGFDVDGNIVDINTNNRSEIDIEVKRTYSSDEMAAAVDAIQPELPEEAYVLSGNCSYRFAGSGWDWFLRDYAERMVTKNLSTTQYMFQGTTVENIPFEFNCSDSSYSDMGYMFYNATNLKFVGKIKKAYPNSLTRLFANCYNLRCLPEIENMNFSRLNSYSYSNISGMFSRCYSLRAIPEDFLKNIYVSQATTSSYTVFNNGFENCCSLDEVKGLMPITGTCTSDLFSYTFDNCTRLKTLLFALQEDNTPYVVNWKNQTINIISLGYGNKNQILNYNSGITADKEVTDDATYQALKDDPDWFTTKVEYSRYNHDSAVATINSLPDTSAYLASAGGTNTIKFKGASGSKTDGGAINTLSEAEIAVATAKGWTVSLV